MSELKFSKTYKTDIECLTAYTLLKESFKKECAIEEAIATDGSFSFIYTYVGELNKNFNDEIIMLSVIYHKEKPIIEIELSGSTNGDIHIFSALAFAAKKISDFFEFCC